MLLFQQEIMVGSQYQAEIPSLTRYSDHEKGKYSWMFMICLTLA